MSSILSRILVEICSAKRSIEKKTGETSIIIVLLGTGGRGLRQRRALRNRLASMGMVALIPEDDFPREVAPSLVEEAVLSKGMWSWFSSTLNHGAPPRSSSSSTAAGG